MSDVRLAYLAGLMDGEGSFSIQVGIRQYSKRPCLHINPRMTMTLKYGRAVLEELVEMFGGKIYKYENEDKWCLGTLEEIKKATIALQPYLRIKSKVAEKFMEALSLFPDKRSSHLSGDRSWTLEKAIRIAEIASTMNPGGDKTRKINKDQLIARIHEIYAGKDEIIRDYDKVYEVNGKALTVSEWSKELGISINGLRTRMWRNWPLEKVFSA